MPMEMIPEAVLFMQMGSDVPVEAELLLIAILSLPIAAVATVAELLMIQVVVVRKGRVTIGHLIGLVVVAALLMAPFAWLPDSAGFLIGLAAFSATLAALVDLTILARLDVRRARPCLPAGARRWFLIGGPVLLFGIALSLVTVFYDALAGTSSKSPRVAIIVPYLILLVPIAAMVAFRRSAEFTIEAHRTARPRPVDDSPSLPG